MLIIPKEDGTFHTTIYRKPTHTDMYLQWDSQHPISSKCSVVGTLHHRARTVCSNSILLQQEEEHLHEALTTCKYPNWALNRIKMKVKSNPKKKNISQNKNTMPKTYQQPYLVVPYYQGLSESVKRTCGKYGIQVHFKEVVSSKASWWHQKIQTQCLKEVVSSTNIHVIGWSVMKSALVSISDNLMKGSKNTKRPHPYYLTIIPPLVITSNLKISL